MLRATRAALKGKQVQILYELVTVMGLAGRETGNVPAHERSLAKAGKAAPGHVP